MNRRRFVTVIAALCVVAAIILVIIIARGGADDLTVCEARARAADRIAVIEGPGYDKGLESLDELREAARRDDPPDTGLQQLIDQLEPLLEQVEQAYADGGFDAVDALPTDVREPFERLTDRLDVELAEHCGGTVPGTMPDGTRPTPTTVEGTVPAS